MEASADIQTDDTDLMAVVPAAVECVRSDGSAIDPIPLVLPTLLRLGTRGARVKATSKMFHRGGSDDREGTLCVSLTRMDSLSCRSP